MRLPTALRATFRTVPARSVLVTSLLVAALGCQNATARTTAPQDAALPAAETLDDFAPTSDYVFSIADSRLPDARLFLSQRGAAFLVVAPALESPLLLLARTGEVVRLDPAAIEVSNASATVPGSARRGSVSKLVGADDGVLFSVGGRVHRLRVNVLVGEQTGAAIYEHSIEYRQKAAGYRPDPATLAALRSLAKPVVVRVVFATWCHVCKSYLPNLMRVADDLAGSQIRFEYFGVPDWKHPEVQRLGVKELPTAVVFVGGTERGRFAGAEGFKQAEASLLDAAQ